MVLAQEVQDVEEDRGDDASALPVTGWKPAPVLGEENDLSRLAKDFDAVEFVRSPLGVKFFREWLQGRVTCRLVGQRFGYQVLGKFYAIKDEIHHAQKEGVANDAAEEVARTRVTTEGWGAGVTVDSAAGSGAPATAMAVVEGPRPELDTECAAYDQGEVAQPGHLHEGSSGVSSEPGVVSAAEVLAQLEESQEESGQELGQEVNAEAAGSKQTNLMHWLK